MKWYCIPERYDCIDAHNHVWGTPNNGPLNVEQTKQLLYSADCLGIRKLCVSYPITKPGVTVESMRYVNDIVVEAMKMSDRLIGFCFVDAALGQAAVDEVKRCVVENGMAGIKMYHQQFLEDDVQAPVMELAAELGVPVLMHAGKCTDPATMASQPYLSNASNFLKAVKKFPKTTFIQGHIGGGGDWEWNLRILEEMDSDNYFIDISGSVIDAGIVRSTVNAVGIARGVEDIWGQYKYSPGRYTSYIYKVASHNVFERQNGDKTKLHQLDFEANVQQGYADEYRQQLIQEKDPESGYTSYRYEKQMEYRKRCQVTIYDVNVHYRFSCYNDKQPTGYLGAKADLQGFTNKHLLPTSKLDCQRMNLSVEGGYNLFGDRLFLDATVTYSHAQKADLTLADATTDYATQVLLPDMQYYDADYWRGQLSAKYLFPIKENKAYVKGYADILKAQHSLSQNTYGLTLGLYY